MQTLIKQLKEINDNIQAVEITDDELISWRHNRVTRRLFLELRYAICLSLLPEYEGPTEYIEDTALKFNYKKGMGEAFDMIIDWQPQDLLEDNE